MLSALISVAMHASASRTASARSRRRSGHILLARFRPKSGCTARRNSGADPSHHATSSPIVLARDQWSVAWAAVAWNDGAVAAVRASWWGEASAGGNYIFQFR